MGQSDAELWGSVANGLPYPLTRYLLFGFTGALVPTLVSEPWRVGRP